MREEVALDANLSALIDILQVIGIIVITLALAGLAYKLIMYKDNADKRTILMQSTSKILIGALIIGGMLSISGFLNGFINKLAAGTSQEALKEITYVQPTIEKDDKGGIAQKIIANAIEWIPDFVLGRTDEELKGKSDEEKEKDKNKLEEWFGFKPLDTLLGESADGNEDTLFNKNAPPGQKSEWDYIMMGYQVVRVISIILLIIMVFKTGVSMVFSSDNEKKLEEVKEDVYRWVFVCIIIAMGPLLVDGILSFFGWLNSLVNVPGINTTDMNNIKTGNVVATQCVRLYYCYLTVRLNVMFMISKWCVAVMVIFTPLAAALWGINKRFHAFEIWLGEIISNGAMKLCYSLVFLVYSLIFMSGTLTVVETLIGLTLIIKLGDILRNSLNGLMARIGGMDEAGQSGSILGSAFSNSINGVKRLARATGGITDLAKGFSGNGDNSEQFAKMGNSHNLANAVNGDSSNAQIGAVAEMMNENGNTSEDSSGEGIASDIASGGPKPTKEATVQDMFMQNLASKKAVGSRNSGHIMGMAYKGANLEKINKAKEETIGQMKSIYEKNGLKPEEAEIKAKTEFNKSMYGADKVGTNGALTKEGKKIDKEFSSRLAKGEYHNARRNLVNTNKTERLESLFKNTI